MNVSLSPELEQFVQEKVASGQFQSIDAAINEGLRLLMLRERIYKGRFEELRREIMIGIESSERGEVIDGETAMRELLEELEKRRIEAEQ